jgi:hypothetical protein
VSLVETKEVIECEKEKMMGEEKGKRVAVGEADRQN